MTARIATYVSAMAETGIQPMGWFAAKIAVDDPARHRPDLESLAGLRAHLPSASEIKTQPRVMREAE